MEKFQLLHISDLHVSIDKEFDRSVVLDPLIDRVEHDMAYGGVQLEIVVVTGDVGFSGKATEYEKTKDFFDELLARMNLSADRLFIVPGNHDVDRNQYRPTDVPKYDNMPQLNIELENKRFRRRLFEGMEEYFTFIEENYPHLKSHDNRLIPFVHAFDAQCGKRIGLVGLNSAWMCRKSPDREEIAIGEYQIKKAMEKLKATGKLDVVITLFHHPLSWFWPPDRMICRGYLNNSVILCGHLHDAVGGYVHDYDGRFYQFQAGAGYESSEYPNRFQYVTFDWSENKVRLEFRKFVKESRKWVLDTEKGVEGKKSFELLEKNDGMKKREVDFTHYLTYLRQETMSIDIRGLVTGKGKIHQFPIDELYIPLRTRYCVREDRGMLKGVDDDALLQEALKERRLFIKGDPGSGKTTFMRLIAYTLCQGRLGEATKSRLSFAEPVPLPLLIRLGALSRYISQCTDRPGFACPAEKDSPKWLLHYLESLVLTPTLNEPEQGFYSQII